MLLTKLKTVAVVSLVLCAVAFGGGLLEHPVGDRATEQRPTRRCQTEDGNAEVSNSDGQRNHRAAMRIRRNRLTRKNFMASG